MKHLEGDYPSQDRVILSKDDVLSKTDAIRAEDEDAQS
jgi:hypothetical protein